MSIERTSSNPLATPVGAPAAPAAPAVASAGTTPRDALSLSTGARAGRAAAPASFSFGRALGHFFRGFGLAARDLVTSALAHPLRTLAVVGGGALAMAALPVLLPVSAATIGLALAAGFAGWGAFEMGRGAVRALADYRAGDAARAEADFEEIGRGGFDLATVVAPIGIAKAGAMVARTEAGQAAVARVAGLAGKRPAAVEPARFFEARGVAEMPPYEKMKMEMARSMDLPYEPPKGPPQPLRFGEGTSIDSPEVLAHNPHALDDYHVIAPGDRLPKFALATPRPADLADVQKSDATRYLFTIDHQGLHLAPEHTAFPSKRGVLVHTNLSPQAFSAGEAWQLEDGKWAINGMSGRYGARDPEEWEAVVAFWRQLGFQVEPIDQARWLET